MDKLLRLYWQLKTLRGQDPTCLDFLSPEELAQLEKMLGSVQKVADSPNGSKIIQDLEQIAQVGIGGKGGDFLKPAPWEEYYEQKFKPIDLAKYETLTATPEDITALETHAEAVATKTKELFSEVVELSLNKRKAKLFNEYLEALEAYIGKARKLAALNKNAKKAFVNVSLADQTTLGKSVSAAQTKLAKLKNQPQANPQQIALLESYSDGLADLLNNQKFTVEDNAAFQNAAAGRMTMDETGQTIRVQYNKAHVQTLTAERQVQRQRLQDGNDTRIANCKRDLAIPNLSTPDREAKDAELAALEADNERLKDMVIDENLERQHTIVHETHHAVQAAKQQLLVRKGKQNGIEGVGLHRAVYDLFDEIEAFQVEALMFGYLIHTGSVYCRAQKDQNSIRAVIEPFYAHLPKQQLSVNSTVYEIVAAHQAVNSPLNLVDEINNWAKTADYYQNNVNATTIFKELLERSIDGQTFWQHQGIINLKK